MKEFTCTEEGLKVTHIDSGEVLAMVAGDTVDLPDMMVNDMCSMGWGTSPDSATGDRVPGQKQLTPGNTSSLYRKPPLPQDAPAGLPSLTARTQAKVQDIKQSEKPNQ